MKNAVRYALVLLALCFALAQVKVIRAQSQSVSLRFAEEFTLEEGRSFAAVWGEETTVISGVETTRISFAGDGQLVFPAEYVFGTPPSELKGGICAVSTGFALEHFGGVDVVGMKLEEDTICGVFRCEEPVVLKPGREGFTAAELFPVPAKTDLYRWGRDYAAQAGLAEPTAVLCGPELGFWALILPFAVLLLPLLGLLGRRGWLVAGVMLLFILPEWCFPTRLSDTVFWAELGESLLGRFRDWLALSPALRDGEVKLAWLHLWILVYCAHLSLPKHRKYSAHQ